MDSFDGNRKVDFQEFVTGLRDIGVHETDHDFKEVMTILDKNGDGHIDFNEFLIAIRVS